jgi:hypothetical protein
VESPVKHAGDTVKLVGVPVMDTFPWLMVIFETVKVVREGAEQLFLPKNAVGLMQQVPAAGK